jgi:RNA polymerase sigma-70 factor (ECF subfamily)
MKLNRNFIKNLIKKDEKAYELLYNEYAGKLKAIAYRYTRDVDIADDLVQETFIIVYNKIEQFKFKGSFEAWIKKILINKCLTYLKEQKKINITSDLDKVNAHLKTEEDIDVFDKKSLIKNINFSKEEIMEIILSLSDGYRLVFSLYVLEGFKHKEIAKLLGISENTSKSQLLRARNILQKKLYEKAKQKYIHKRDKNFKDLLNGTKK